MVKNLSREIFMFWDIFKVFNTEKSNSSVDYSQHVLTIDFLQSCGFQLNSRGPHSRHIRGKRCGQHRCEKQPPCPFHDWPTLPQHCRCRLPPQCSFHHCRIYSKQYRSRRQRFFLQNKSCTSIK